MHVKPVILSISMTLLQQWPGKPQLEGYIRTYIMSDLNFKMKGYNFQDMSMVPFGGVSWTLKGGGQSLWRPCSTYPKRQKDNIYKMSKQCYACQSKA